MRARQLVVLVRPTARASEWLAPIAGCAIAIAFDTLFGRISPSIGLELAAVALALGVSFALDDPAEASVEASPVPLAFRHAIRAACVVPLPAVVWVLLATRSDAPDAGTLTLEVASLVALALAIAALGTRAGGSGGPVAAPALLGLVASTAGLRDAIAPLVFWALVLAVAAALAAAACRDPAKGLGRRSSS